MKPFVRGEVLLALGIILLGLLYVAGTLAIPGTGGYERIGPAAYPWAISLSLIVVGGILVRGALRNDGTAQTAGLATPRFAFGPFAFISLGLILHLLLIERAGFIIASATLFFCTARAFGARHQIVTAMIGIALAILVYLAFNHGLDLTLPVGVIKGIG